MNYDETYCIVCYFTRLGKNPCGKIDACHKCIIEKCEGLRKESFTELMRHVEVEDTKSAICWLCLYTCVTMNVAVCLYHGGTDD